MPENGNSRNKGLAVKGDHDHADDCTDYHADYYIDESGLTVFTRKFLLARGYCCKNGCRHCPYQEKHPEEPDS